MASPLSSAINPFAEDRVRITPAVLYDDTFNSKAPVAYELIYAAINSGKITSKTKVVAASSGNTGLGIAQICKAVGLLRCEIVMQNDTPGSKVGTISALGHPIDTVLLSSGTVQYAREKGQQPGWYNVDQYADRANLLAQFNYMAPQLWGIYGNRIDLIVVPGGTLGTAGGLQKYAQNAGFKTKIVLALCADGQEVPGARDEARIRRDVKIASVDNFEYRMTATRYQSFLASYAMFSEIDWTPGGPTSGLALSVALRFLQRHKDAKTLDQFRGPDENLNVVFLCPDDYRLYGDLYRSTLNKDRDFSFSSIPFSRLLEDA
ncbi:MAG TPA: pyridoxal-phosphate dependent enzyme [Candidatus Paceibacterota bacterium]|nr:pyridoxal-phosphate dependent enzyme [Candidatus Paceibacterota bacterium]